MLLLVLRLGEAGADAVSLVPPLAPDRIAALAVLAMLMAEAVRGLAVMVNVDGVVGRGVKPGCEAANNDGITDDDDTSLMCCDDASVDGAGNAVDDSNSSFDNGDGLSSLIRWPSPAEYSSKAGALHCWPRVDVYPLLSGRVSTAFPAATMDTLYGLGVPERLRGANLGLNAGRAKCSAIASAMAVSSGDGRWPVLACVEASSAL